MNADKTITCLSAFERSRWRGRRYACSLFEAFSATGLRLRFRRGNLLTDASYLECSQKSPVVNYFQWNIDSNSNNGPRLPQTPAASFKRPNRKCPGANLSAMRGLPPGHFRLSHSVYHELKRLPGEDAAM